MLLMAFAPNEGSSIYVAAFSPSTSLHVIGNFCFMTLMLCNVSLKCQLKCHLLHLLALQPLSAKNVC